MKTIFSMNVNAIALLRNRRDLPWPNLLHLARLGLQAGAEGITVHPRPDERHIRFKDVALLGDFIKTQFPSAEFNLEGYPSAHFLELALRHAQQITLVPDTPEQKTSDHGWDFKGQFDFLLPIIERIKNSGVRVSLFANPDAEGLEYAQRLGADSVEFYTGPYALCYENQVAAVKELKKLKQAADYAQQLQLKVHMGHDLTVDNLAPLKREIPYLREVSIGHALTCDALEYGIEKAVQRFLAVLK